MFNSTEYIESGLLEAYILGCLSQEENEAVEQQIAASTAVRTAVDEISLVMEGYLREEIQVEPDPIIKPFVMAIIDYTERLKNGEPVSYPPMLDEKSAISDYTTWLNRSDLQRPAHFQDFHAWIIGYTPQMSTAIVWIKDITPIEEHSNELEKFLIVEGTCDITIGDQLHQLVPGDVLSIPLYKKHFVKVTSLMPCKVILQRVAA